MFLSKLKKAVVLATVVLILTAGAGAWRYAPVAGQSEEPSQAVPARAAPKGAASQVPRVDRNSLPSSVQEADAVKTSNANSLTAPPAPGKNRVFQIDLQMSELEDGGRRTLLAEPRLLTLEGRPASFAIGGNRTIPLGGTESEQVWMGTSIRTVIRSAKEGKVHLDLTVSWTAEAKISDAVSLETRTRRMLTETTTEPGSRCEFAIGAKDSKMLVISVSIRESNMETGEKQTAKAEKDFQMAEFWRRTGHPDSARFYYELIQRRYPGTTFDERAKKRLAELEKKPLARVGQIFIIGNKKISDEAILEQVKLYPGQILTYPDLQIAEKNLSRLNGLKSDPKVAVIDREGERVFRDIQITVAEK